MTLHIMVVEDDPAIRQELCQLLTNALYQVSAIEQFDQVTEEVLSVKPDLVLLDLSLPGKSGHEICREIRSRSEIPVIFLTSRTDPMDELTGLLNGGDDYITKPFQPPLLLARIAAVLKRSVKEGKETASVMTYHGVTLDLARGRIFREALPDKQAELTKNELKILHILFQHQGGIVSRMDLIEYLWDQQVFIDDNTLSVNVTRIRTKLQEIGVHDFIGTKRGMGYYI